MSNLRRGFAGIVWGCLWLTVTPGFAQAPKTAEPTAEETRERQAAERFLSLLEKQPRLGTALDKVYGYHIERGTLDEFLATQTKRTTDAKQAGPAWMLIGLMELQRGRDAQAVTAFQEAETIRTDDPYASMYLAKGLLLVGRTDDAAAAYERAITRKPARTELLDLYQQLGQIYQRARKSKEALAVWDRMERAFPDDQRVQEQIATILADENDFASALERFERLAAKASDPYRKVQYQIRVGELKLRLGRNDEALKGLEALLAQLKPDSWLHRDVRQRIESTFLKTDDYDGLAKYYTQWLGNHPDDLDAMSRLANFLALQGRGPEAEEWYRKAIKLAPTNRALRKALIAQLSQAKRVKEAATEYAELDKLEPNNSDTLRAWGQLLFEDRAQEEAIRKPQAIGIWQRLLAIKPKDPVTTSQVADLYRQAKLTEEAIALYRKAIELAPSEPQYREYLGEYLHVLDRRDEAVTVWKEIAAGDKKNTRTLIRLAEVFRGFGYREESLDAMSAGCALQPEFADLLRFAGLLREATKYDDALTQLDRAETLAENDDERDQILGERIKTYVESERLTDQIAAWEHRAKENGVAAAWRTLALLYEAARRPADASRAVAKSLELDNKSAATWTVAARLYENGGNFIEAIRANQQLAALDRRARSDYLQRIATLNLRVGKADEALKAGQEVIAAAPGNPEHYQFYAQLCFQLGRQEDGLTALRRAVRVNPTDQKALLTLASALGEQFRTEEAIELYWRAFDSADNVDDRNSIINTLTPLYLRMNQLDRLIAKLERMGKEQKAEREATIWTATAQQAAGDVGSARELLSRLLTDDSKDTALLNQLVKLAETEFDLEQALIYQRRINDIGPSREGTQRLAGLLMRTGATEEAEELWLTTARNDKQPHRVYEAIDDMVAHTRFESALKLSERLLRDNPQDWEALYRAGLSLSKLKRHDEAAKRFEQLRALSIPETQLSAKAEFQKQQAQQRTATSGTATSNRAIQSGYPVGYPPILMRQQAFYLIRQALDLNDEYGSSSATRTVWSPADFGQARMVAPTAEVIRAATAGKLPEIIQRCEAQLTDPDTSPDQLWDLYGISTLLQNYENQSGVATINSQSLAARVARKLSDRDDPTGKLIYLASLSTRNTANQARSARQNVAVQKVDPLGPADLDHMLACYRAVSAANPDWLGWTGAVALVAAELKLAKRDDAAEVIYKEARDRARDYRSMSTALQLAMALGRQDEMESLLEQHAAQLAAPSSYGSQGLLSLWVMVVNGVAEKNDKAALQKVVAKAVGARIAATASQPITRRSTSTFGSASSSGGMSVSVRSTTGNYRSVQITYPLPNVYFDSSSIQSLYSMFSLVKERNGLPETIAAFQQQAETADGDAKVMYRLVSTYWLWWGEQKIEALDELRALIQLVPDRPELRLELAQLQIQHGNERDALAVLDGFEPLDNSMLRDRELLALQVAVALNDVDRAKKGVERLFGMQLDANVQFQLAQLMHQLGLHEMAENVLTRIRKRSGNQSQTLVQLMQQYQTQGNQDSASQIALQLLRRGAPSSGSRGRTSEDVNRETALRVLSQSGQLAKIIERTEGQLSRSPNSVTLLESLAEYYRAANKPDKAQELLERLTKNQPTDSRALYARASQLYRSGQHSAACDVFIQALKADPASLDNRFYDMQSAFQQAKRTADFANALLEIDFKGTRSYYRFTEVSNELLNDAGTRELAMKLFRKAWDNFPQSRSSLLGQMYREEFWQSDDAYQYAREGILPKPGTALTPWQGLAETMSYNSDGRVTGLLTRLVKMTASAERREKFAAEVQTAVNEHPNWSGGVAILAVFDAQANRTEAAQTRIRQLLDKGAFDGRAAQVVAQEFDTVAALRPLALRLLESTQNDEQIRMSGNGFRYDPARYLAQLHHRDGRRDKARQIILEALGRQDYSRYSANNPGYGEYQELQGLQAAAEDFQKMKMPLDTIRLLDQALADPKRITAAARWGGGNFAKTFETQRQTAEQSLTTEILSQELRSWVRVPPAPDQPADALQPERAVDGIKPMSRPAVDFMLSVQPRTVDAARMTSLFENALSAAVGKPVFKPVAAVAPNESPRTQPTAGRVIASVVGASKKPAAETKPEVNAESVAAVLVELRQQLAHVQSRCTEDGSIVTALALVELLDPKAESTTTAAAMTKLDERFKASPQDKKSGEADFAIWLVARLAQQHAAPEVRDAAKNLTDHALRLARTADDRKWLHAILREQGQMALESGDKAAAERLWSELLDEILRGKPEEKLKSPTATGS